MTHNNDAHLGTFSNESLEVLSHFGTEAPVKLNAYACKLEDALLDTLKREQQQAQQLALQAEYIEKVQGCLQAAQAEREAMQQILSDPEQLLKYVSTFFGPEGPCPGGAVISRCHQPGRMCSAGNATTSGRQDG
jgi:hypothetical protein